MIPPELYAQIRRLFYAEHWRLNTFAAQLGVHHDTVRRVVESERFIRTGTQVRPSALDPYKGFVRATLEQYPRLRATRLWAMVRERGYPGSVTQVQRYVRTVRPAARVEAYLRLDTMPGEQAQVDWGNFGPIRVGTTTRSLSCFVLVLSWSRACYAHFALAARPFRSVEDLNAQLARWIAEVAHTRPVPGRREQRVAEALAEEQPRLLPLPEHPFPCQLLRVVTSGKTPYIRFDGNDYSIPHRLIRRPLTLVAADQVVRILDGSMEVARHARSYDRGQRIDDDAHLAALVAEKRRAQDLRGRDRLRQACPHTDAFLDALALRGEPLTRPTTQLLRLLHQVGASALDTALGEALARGAFSAVSVAHILDQLRRARRLPPPVDVVLPDDPRVRELRVTPHALSAYDTLLTSPPDEETPHGPIG
jgi:hypothetical protein